MRACVSSEHPSHTATPRAAAFPSLFPLVATSFANKQDMPGALTPKELIPLLGLDRMRDRRWHVQASVALKGDGLYEGLDWLSACLRSMQREGEATSVGNSKRFFVK